MPPIVFLTLLVSCERRDPAGGAEKNGRAIATVNGEALTETGFNSFLPDGYSEALTLAEKKSYLDRWVTTHLLYEEALAAGYGDSPEITARMEQYRKDLVADMLVQRVIKDRAVVTEEEVRAYYDAHEHEYTRELRVSHILVNSLEDAEKVREALQKRSFSWVARRQSIDKHTGVGGDLGFLSKGNMIPEFEEVVFDMEVGEISDIVESEFGYHFIKLTDVREARDKLTYEDVAEDISRELLLRKRTAVYDSLIATVYASADIRILDPELRMAADISWDAPADSVTASE